jgi:hypothetical protein
MEEGRKGGRIRERAKSLKEKRRKREERDFKRLFKIQNIIHSFVN